MLPQEQRHLLPLLKYSPYEEVIEVKGNQQRCILKDRGRSDLLTAAGWHILLLDEKVWGVDKREGSEEGEMEQGNKLVMEGTV